MHGLKKKKQTPKRRAVVFKSKIVGCPGGDKAAPWPFSLNADSEEKRLWQRPLSTKEMHVYLFTSISIFVSLAVYYYSERRPAFQLLSQYWSHGFDNVSAFSVLYLFLALCCTWHFALPETINRSYNWDREGNPRLKLRLSSPASQDNKIS